MITLKFKINLFKLIPPEIKSEEYYIEKSYDANTRFKDAIKDVISVYYQESKPFIMIDNLHSLFWGKYFSFLGTLTDESNLEYYSLLNLERQFNIDEEIIEISINPPIGGSVGVHRGIHFFFHTNERDLHHRPHIHVKYENIEFRIDLETLKILDKKTFKSNKKTAIALKIVKLNQQELLNYWHKVVVNGESVKFQMFYLC